MNIHWHKKWFKFSVCSIAVMAVLCSADAYAQNSKRLTTKLPDISVPPIEAELNRDNVLNAENFTEYKIQNKYLADKITLQYQIALIENLITWQKQVSEIQKAYTSIGVNYTTPQPPRGLCEQVPANVPCFNAYPEVYPGTEDVLEQRLKELDEQKAQKASAVDEVAALQNALRPNLNSNETAQSALDAVIEKAAKGDMSSSLKKKPVAVTSNYEWIEIFCLSGICEAVLGSKENGDFRRTVKVDETLPDGSRVTKVQPGRMEVTKAGEIIRLDPAPLNRNEAPVPREIPTSLGDLEAQFSGFPGANMTAPTNAPRATTPLNDAAPVPLTDDSGLGETGLF
ncbi:MAG: hypothetical protein CMH30_08965 [Micavibrio sp.]|nr:hypothetical protein [Micavibrio sp.]